MDPVETFKFSCPGCGQHLEAHAEEAGQIIVCPLCTKQLIVPQAPADRNSKLLITAAVVQTKRPPTTDVSSPMAVVSRGSGLPKWLYPVLGVLLVVGVGLAAVVFWRGTKQERKPPESGVASSEGLWTTNFNQLDLTSRELSGRLNGWDFVGNRPVWRGTKLVLRQRNATPRELGIEVDLPLKGGELVAGKRFEVTANGEPLPKPVVISWRDEEKKWQRRSYPQGYILKLEFTEVTPTHVSGRIHLCLGDPANSWVAGAFMAEVKTQQ